MLTPEKLLEKYVGKTIGLVKTNPTICVETTEQVTVLLANSDVMLKVGNHIETGVPLARIVYENVLENLRDRPTLVTKINNKDATNQNVLLSYLKGGVGWKAD